MTVLRILLALAVIGVGVLGSSNSSYSKWSELSRILRADLSAGDLNVYAPVSSDVDNDLCRNHSAFYADSVKRNAQWALTMLDASSTPPDAILAGNTVQLGNYDQCVQIEGIAVGAGKFSGQHCLVLVGQHGKNRKKMQSLFYMLAGDDNDGTMEAISLGVRWSLCLPSSCRPGDVTAHLQSVFSKSTLRVDDVTCSSRDSKTVLSYADWFAICVCCVLVCLATLSTAYDVVSARKVGPANLLVSFSVISNAKKLLSTSKTDKNKMAALEGVRVVNMMWVIVFHRGLYDLFTPAVNLHLLRAWMSDWRFLIITNSTFSVDSFLLISGLLVCYNFFRDVEAKRPFNLPRFYLLRYIRLTPPYAMAMLLMGTLSSYIGDGPSWSYNMDAAHEACSASWWASLLYINNYGEVENMCLPHAWSLSVDMQLFWLSPIILYPLWRCPRLGKALIGGLLCVGVVTAFLVPYLNQLNVDVTMSRKIFLKLYLPTHTRFLPWLIGVCLGYVLHKTKHTTQDISTVRLALGWLTSTVLMLSSVMLGYRFLQTDRDYEHFLESLYWCLVRPAWALGLAWVIFACVKGHGGFVNAALSWRGFEVLGRLSYTIFLVHFCVMTWMNASAKYPVHLSIQYFVTQFLGDMTFSLVLAVLLVLLVEAPVAEIKNYVVNKRTSLLPNSCASGGHT